jgi:glycosyltransferase involved in cell wall biosynthesis
MTRTFTLQQSKATTTVLQLCHGYGQPFLDVAKQGVSLFQDRDVAVTTVYLTGPADAQLAADTGGDEVIFLELTSREIRGLKRKAIARVRDICRQRGIRFAIAHRYKPIYVASHVPGLFVVGVHHAFGGYERVTRRWYVNRRRQNMALLGVSNAVRDDVRASLPAWPQESIQTLYNRVDFAALQGALLRRAQAREQLGVSDDTFVFANVGRLHADKDQHTLIAAFAQVAPMLPSAQLLIIGKGKLAQALQQQIDGLGLQDRVRLTGPIPNAARVFSGFDAFVLSSHRESFGMVLLEAMAASVPIATSDCGGTTEVVGDSGLSFPVGDVEALAACLRRLYELDPQERGQWVQRMEQQVHRRFTLTAGAQVFWGFPWVQRHLGQTLHAK